MVWHLLRVRKLPSSCRLQAPLLLPLLVLDCALSCQKQQAADHVAGGCKQHGALQADDLCQFGDEDGAGAPHQVTNGCEGGRRGGGIERCVFVGERVRRGVMRTRMLTSGMGWQ